MLENSNSFVLKIFLRIWKYFWESKRLLPDSNNLLYTLLPMNGKEAGKQKLEITVTVRSLSLPIHCCTVTAFMLIGGWENTSRSKKPQKRYFKDIIHMFSIHEHWPRHPPSPCIINQEGWREYFYKQTHTLTLWNLDVIFSAFPIICVFSK